jgi:HEAT repeat protein
VTLRVLRRLFDVQGDKVVGTLRAMANSGTVPVRVEAIRLLGRIKRDKETTTLLEELLNVPVERVRIAAALTYLGG